jgi:hypothetical protein
MDTFVQHQKALTDGISRCLYLANILWYIIDILHHLYGSYIQDQPYWTSTRCPMRLTADSYLTSVFLGKCWHISSRHMRSWWWHSDTFVWVSTYTEIFDRWPAHLVCANCGRKNLLNCIFSASRMVICSSTHLPFTINTQTFVLCGWVAGVLDRFNLFCHNFRNHFQGS